VGIGVGGTFAVGALARIGASGGQLVHLTNADSAAAIRGSQSFGLPAVRGSPGIVDALSQ